MPRLEWRWDLSDRHSSFGKHHILRQNDVRVLESIQHSASPNRELLFKELLFDIRQRPGKSTFRIYLAFSRSFIVRFIDHDHSGKYGTVGDLSQWDRRVQRLSAAARVSQREAVELHRTTNKLPERQQLWHCRVGDKRMWARSAKGRHCHQPILQGGQVHQSAHRSRWFVLTFTLFLSS